MLDNPTMNPIQVGRIAIGGTESEIRPFEPAGVDYTVHSARFLPRPRKAEYS